MNVNLFLFLLFISPGLFAQPVFDAANVRHQYFPNQYFKSSTEKKVSNESNINLMVPWIQKDSSKIFTGIVYRRIHCNDEMSAFMLHSFGVWVGYEFKWKDRRWSTTTFFIPKISADEFSTDGKNVQYGGAVLFKYRKRQDLHYHFGLYYNRELFGNYYVPLLGINWRISERTYLYGNMPTTLNLEYKLNPSFYTGLSYVSLTSTFSLNKNFNDLYLKEGQRGIGHTHIRLFLHWYFMKNIVFFFEPGMTYTRKYNLYDFNEEKYEYNSSANLSRTKDGFVIVAGIAYRIRLDAK